MQLTYHILAFAVFASALPSAEKQDPSNSQQIGKDGALMAAGQCKIGQRYCFGAIVGDLSTSCLILTVRSTAGPFVVCTPLSSASTNAPQGSLNRISSTSIATRSTRTTGRAATGARGRGLCQTAGTGLGRRKAYSSVRGRRHTSGWGGVMARARIAQEGLVAGRKLRAWSSRGGCIVTVAMGGALSLFWRKKQASILGLLL
ncbi:hypothetical protein M3J09_001719 [Ascochyta lentis]